MAILGFIFQSSVAEIQNEQFLANCPLPIHRGTFNNTDIDGVNVTYEIIYQNSTSSVTNSLLICRVVDPDIPTYAVEEVVTTYTGSLINDQISFMFYIGDWISAQLERASHQLYLMWLFVDAPAQVTGLAFFSIISALSFGFFGLGIFIVLRSGGIL